MHGSVRLDEGSYGPSPGASRYLSATDLLNILRRRAWLIMASVAVGLGLTAIILLRTTPIYTATTTLEVESSSAPIGGAPVDVVNPVDELNIETQMQLLKSRPLARMIVQDQRLDLDPDFAVQSSPSNIARIIAWFNPPENKAPVSASSTVEPARSADDAASAQLEAVVDRLLDAYSVDRVGRSYLIEVNLRSPNPDKARKLADVIAGTHVKRLNAETRADTTRQITEMTSEVEQLRQRALDDDRKVANYERSRNLLTGYNSSADVGELGRLNGQLADARVSRVETQARSRGLQDGASEASGTAAVATSPLLADLRAQEAAMLKRIAELSALYGPGYPEMVTASAQLAEVRSRMAAESTRVAATLRNEVAINQAREGQLTSDVSRLRAQAMGQSTAVELMDLQRAADSSRAFYVAQLSRLKQITAQEGDAGPPTTITARATLPTDPTSPQPVRTLGIALIGSLLLGLVLAVVAEAFDTHIRTADQVGQILGLPTFAMVPRLTKSVKDAGPIHDQITDRPQSAFAEAMHDAYMETVRVRTAGGAQVVAVTSPLPGDGKTTIAASLAATAARVGRRAVVVDLDFRRPGLQQSLRRDCGGVDGLAYLTGDAGLEKVIGTDRRQPRLATVCISQPAHDPAALLASERLQTFIHRLRSRFDFIVLNLPPVLPMRDARTVSEMADTTLMVLRWGVTSPSSARAAVRALNGHVAGAILNGVDVRKHARRAYGDALQHHSSYAPYFEPVRPAASYRSETDVIHTS